MSNRRTNRTLPEIGSRVEKPSRGRWAWMLRLPPRKLVLLIAALLPSLTLSTHAQSPVAEDDATTEAETRPRLRTWDWTLDSEGNYFFQPTRQTYQSLIYDEKITKQNEIDEDRRERIREQLAAHDAQMINMLRQYTFLLEDRQTTMIDGKPALLYMPEKKGLSIPEGAFRGSETDYAPMEHIQLDQSVRIRGEERSLPNVPDDSVPNTGGGQPGESP